MDGNFEIVNFQKEYCYLNNKFKKTEEELFNLGVVVAYISELGNGFMVKKQLKTNSRGTKFSYEKINNQEELNEYVSKVKKMLDKLDSNMLISEFDDNIKKYNK